MSALVESAKKLVLSLGKDDELLQDLHTDVSMDRHRLVSITPC